MESPQNAVWGPPLWLILHSAAERFGTKPHMAKEEIRIWSGLLSSLRYSLPCPLCKKHYSLFYTSHPIHLFTKGTLRKWLYFLHSQVNQRHQKLDAFTLEQIPEVYGEPFHFTKEYHIVTIHMGHAVRLGWSTREDIVRTARFFEEMKRFYDFF